MKVLFSLAGILFISGLISAHKQPLHYPVREDKCAPEPVCHQCITGSFPADLCCQNVQNYLKLQLANPNDCTSYFQCANNRAVRVYCPVGLHWSIYSERCEWPIDARCGIDGDTPVSPDPGDDGGDEPGWPGDDGGGEPGWPGDDGGGEPGWPGDDKPGPDGEDEDNGGTSLEVVGGGENDIGEGENPGEIGDNGENGSSSDGDSGIGEGGNNRNGNDGYGNAWNHNSKTAKLNKSTNSKTT